MHEEPLNLIPPGAAPDGRSRQLNGRPRKSLPTIASSIEGELCPFVPSGVRELSEPLRRRLVGKRDEARGQREPPAAAKDEKNQDSTELTGDINYRKIAEYGSDSDPRAFNFDGEFNIANRGMIEFIEVLKLDVAFLYDLLGAARSTRSSRRSSRRPTSTR